LEAEGARRLQRRTAVITFIAFGERKASLFMVFLLWLEPQQPEEEVKKSL